jgi:hypothetical protein
MQRQESPDTAILCLILHTLFLSLPGPPQFRHPPQSICPFISLRLDPPLAHFHPALRPFLCLSLDIIYIYIATRSLSHSIVSFLPSHHLLPCPSPTPLPRSTPLSRACYTPLPGLHSSTRQSAALFLAAREGPCLRASPQARQLPGLAPVAIHGNAPPKSP